MKVAWLNEEPLGGAIARLTGMGAPAVDPLCDALNDSRDAVRFVAARALCGIGDARALVPMLPLRQ